MLKKRDFSLIAFAICCLSTSSLHESSRFRRSSISLSSSASWGVEVERFAATRKVVELALGHGAAYTVFDELL
jgi:hypothetical protein